MMAAAKSAIRAIVLPSPDTFAADTPTRRLLGDLGHDVTRAATPNHATELMNADHTDLLVVDVTNNNANRQLFDSLIDMPESHRPDEVAIFTDEIDMALRDLRRRMSPSHVHVFLKPLHMHGLLHVLRRMEREHAASGPVA
jgi:DNA-binding NtrC family response regulator